MITYTTATDGRSGGVHLAPGFYPARVQTAEETQSKNGAPMIKLEIIAMGTEGTETLHEYLTFMEKAVWKVDQFRYAIGEDVTPGKTVAVDARALVGRECWVCLEEEEVQTKEGKLIKVSRVRRYYRSEDVPRQQQPAQQPAKKSLLEQATGKAYGSNGIKAYAANDDEADDIPF